MSGQLKGKIAVITGAASGMGAETARLFHRHGARLVLSDISEKVHDVAAELGERSVAITADVSLTADANTMIELALSEFGGIDVLCNIAGAMGTRGVMTDCTDENFELLIAINLRGPFLTMRAAIPHMIARGGGSIVNVCSTAGIKAYPGLITYGAAKAGLVNLTAGAAAEFAKHGVRVNAICPGPIDTPMFRKEVDGVPGAMERITGKVPMGRPGQVREIAEPILFLASSASSYMTGAILPVEGGQTA
jgi:NAD(P)-dependent dehydrogenase (short-subunit alcohol dehydrogenase family)